MILPIALASYPPTAVNLLFSTLSETGVTPSCEQIKICDFLKNYILLKQYSLQQRYSWKNQDYEYIEMETGPCT